MRCARLRPAPGRSPDPVRHPRHRGDGRARPPCPSVEIGRDIERLQVVERQIAGRGRFFIDFACSEQRLAIDTVISRKRVGEVDAERRGA
jgi:hypothetical protein